MGLAQDHSRLFDLHKTLVVEEQYWPVFCMQGQWTVSSDVGIQDCTASIGFHGSPRAALLCQVLNPKGDLAHRFSPFEANFHRLQLAAGPPTTRPLQWRIFRRVQQQHAVLTELNEQPRVHYRRDPVLRPCKNPHFPFGIQFCIDWGNTDQERLCLWVGLPILQGESNFKVVWVWHVQRCSRKLFTLQYSAVVFNGHPMRRHNIDISKQAYQLRQIVKISLAKEFFSFPLTWRQILGSKALAPTPEKLQHMWKGLAASINENAPIRFTLLWDTPRDHQTEKGLRKSAECFGKCGELLGANLQSQFPLQLFARFRILFRSLANLWSLAPDFPLKTLHQALGLVKLALELLDFLYQPASRTSSNSLKYVFKLQIVSNRTWSK